MKPTKSPAKSDDTPRFVPVTDPQMPAKLFDLALKHRLPVTFWFKRQTLRFDTRLTGSAADGTSASFALPADVTARKFSSTLTAQDAPEIFACIQADDVTFFFRSPVRLEISGATASIEAPKKLYKLQRRADVRIPFRRKSAPKVTLLDPSKIFDADYAVQPGDILAFRVLDISVSGLGFAAKPELGTKFHKGAMIKDMRFWLHGMEIISHGVIQHSVKTKNEDGLPIVKVGVRFHKLKPAYGRQIFGFVLEESRNVFQVLYGQKS